MLVLISRLLLWSLVCLSAFSLPVPSLDTDTLLELIQLQQELLSSQQAQLQALTTGELGNMVQNREQMQQLLSRDRLSAQDVRGVAKQQLAGQLSNIIQRAAKNIFDKVESKSPSSNAVSVAPGSGVKLHFKAPQQPPPQVYYTPPAVPFTWSQPPYPVPQVPNVHIHPRPAPVSRVPEVPQVHIYPPEEKPPPKPQTPPTPHLHIHPANKNSAAIKPLPSIPPMKPLPPPSKPLPPASKPPVLHIHPSPSENQYPARKPGYKDRKENDVQLKLNMDFKAHNRTGFQELERLMNQAQIQSGQGLAAESVYLARGQGTSTLLSMLQNRAAVQELSDIVTARVLREVEAQLFGL